MGLLLGTPGDDTRTEGKAVANDRVASVWAIGIIRVRIACKGCHKVAAQDEGKVPSTFHITRTQMATVQCSVW